MQAKYAEFLGLPLDIAYHSGLTFAVAHRVHGYYQMRTGWPLEPHTLQDRVDGLNNIPNEARTTISFKTGFDETCCVDLENILS